MQYLFNGLIAGCIYAVLALGISIILRVFHFFHLALGAVFAVSAYSLYTLGEILKYPLWVSILLSIGISIVFGILIYQLLRWILFDTNNSPLILLLISFGVLITTEGIIALIFGAEMKQLSVLIEGHSIDVLGARIAREQLIIVLSTLAIFLFLDLWLRLTNAGRKIRAMGSDLELAKCVGIEIDRTSLLIFGIVSAVSGMAAALFTFNAALFPSMGMYGLLIAIVAVIVGGNSHTVGPLVGGIFIGIVQQLTVWKLPAHWQDVAVFMILILFLFLKPYGFFGRPLRKTTV
jgi:branched-chain amino acid transport system permease protein